VMRGLPCPTLSRSLTTDAWRCTTIPLRPVSVLHLFVAWPSHATVARVVTHPLTTIRNCSIPTIAVHEAYPGHHWHLSWMKDNPRPVRKAVTTPYFSEGWALYAERVMREYGFFTSVAEELGHLDARIFRAARIVVDTSLHIGDMEFEEAVEFMMRQASLSEPTARAEVG